MSYAFLLLPALVLDALFGEPRWLWDRIPHPAVLMGNAVGWLDRQFNHGQNRKRKGTLCLIGLLAVGMWIGQLIADLAIGPFLEILFAAILIAQRSLVDHVRAVANGLWSSLHDGITEVAKIVGRDTADMDEPAIARAAIESAAENFSDGIVAPVFWFLLLGLPGLFMYKLTNTADSMIGYKTKRHLEFGWAAARFDDLINWIPARLSALLIAIAHRRTDIWKAATRDAKIHRSPNAGWPEAAMAAALNVALAGPRSYDGTMQDFPYIYSEGEHDISAIHIEESCKALWRTWVVLFVGIVVLAVV